MKKKGSCINSTKIRTGTTSYQKTKKKQKKIVISVFDWFADKISHLGIIFIQVIFASLYTRTTLLILIYILNGVRKYETYTIRNAQHIVDHHQSHSSSPNIYVHSTKKKKINANMWSWCRKTKQGHNFLAMWSCPFWWWKDEELPWYIE